MSNAIGEVVDGFGQMDVVQVSTHQYLVTSWRNDTQTAYHVDLTEPECGCPDDEYNKTGSQVCPHVMKVAHLAETVTPVERQAVQDLADLVGEAREAVRDIENVRDVAQAAQTANAQAAVSQASDGDESEPDIDPVEAMEAWLDDHGLDPADFEIWVDDDYGSLQVDQDGYLDDDEFNSWVSAKENTPIAYDGDQDLNYIKPEDFGEVFG